ncbi:MAG: helicase, partial [Deltaproteobacteria bacterium]|nr:helicase [Deltaproteobacteria bacterium]
MTAEAPAREQGSPNGHIALPYGEFLASKRIASRDAGLSVDPGALHPLLHPFQRHITDWALRKGKAAVFADCGLGKSPIQLQWAQQVHEHSGRDVLILAPLAVSKQTVREGVKFDVPVNICRRQEDVRPGVNIANYEMLQHFDPAEFGGIVLDESSCLKSYSSVYRQQITEFASSLPSRLACTATPAPNDLIELINHAEFLSVMQGKEIIALFFTQD